VSRFESRGESETGGAPLLLLGLALALAAGLLLALQHELTFFQDTWAFLMRRRELSADALLQPHNEHIVLLPVAIESLLIAVFGMTSAAPEQVVLTLALLTAAVLLFVYVRRRIGPWPALFASVLLLFVGPAWQVLIWPFQIGFVGALCSGIAALLALDRGDRRGDLACCAFLVLAIAFSSLGIAFVVGATVDVLQRRRSHGLRRAYVAAVPLLLFAAWWAGWGHDAESHVTLDNVLGSPEYVFDGLASSLDSVLGLSTITVDGAGEPEWGRPILVALVVLLALAQFRRPGVSPRLWPVAAAAATFWLLAAFNFIPAREPTSSRYMYAGAVFVLLIAAELLRGVRFSRTALIAGGALTLAAVASNIVPLRDGRDWLHEQTVLTRSDLAAIEIARETVDPLFPLAPEVAGTDSLIDIQAGSYLDAVDDHGSPAYTPAELADAPEAGRRQADIVLSQALPLATEDGSDVVAGECLTFPEGRAAVPLRPGETLLEVAPGPPAGLSLRRFARNGFPVLAQDAPGGAKTLLTIPADTVNLPWRLQVEAAQAVRVCGTRAG
jgi:hypothetical protein